MQPEEKERDLLLPEEKIEYKKYKTFAQLAKIHSPSTTKE